MTLSIKNGGYALLIKLNLMFSVIVKRVQIISNFKLPNKHLSIIIH